MGPHGDDPTAVRIAVRRELHLFFRRLVGLAFATLGVLAGLGAMVLPFVARVGGESLFVVGMLTATLCSWWIVGATAGPDFEDLTAEID
jgi:hypothetical protein